MSLAKAIETGDLSQLPSRRDEDWRWTDLRGLIREPIRKTVTEPGFGAIGWSPTNKAGEEKLVRPPFDASRHVTITNGQVGGLGPNQPFTLTFDTYDPVVELAVVSQAANTGHSASIRIVVPAGLKAVLLESHQGIGGYLSSVELAIDIGDGASLERVVLAEEDVNAVVMVEAKVVLGAEARFEQTVLTSGARRQRIETHVEHPGLGAFVRLDGVYVNALQAHSDITTVVTHSGVGGTTDQLIKGVVSDQARGVFQGRIVVAHGADKTDARMGHHALILSERAEVDAKPELEIYADDVACAHGNTVGALDEDALFYAQQRGIPDAEARAMLTQAFLGEVVDRIVHDGARDVAAAWLAERLGAGQ